MAKSVPAVRSFIVRDVLGRIWVRYQGVVEDYNHPAVILSRCAHKHRMARFAQRCAENQEGKL